MNINILDHLDEYEIKNIVEDEFRESIKKIFSNEKEINRIIINLGYDFIFKAVEEEVPNYKELIKEQVKERCNNISSYSVFRDKDMFNNESSLGKKYLDEAISQNKNIINEKIIEIFKELEKQDIADEICNILENKIYDLFISKK